MRRLVRDSVPSGSRVGACPLPPPPQERRRARASLSDLSAARDIESLSVRQLKEILARNFVNYSGCCEKWELVERVGRLYRETEENRRSSGCRRPVRSAPWRGAVLC